jgi:pyridoxine/pyridoxamine 5'-phosphate oxidase
MPVMREHAEKYFGKRPAPAVAEAALKAQSKHAKATVKLAKATQSPVTGK